MHTHDAQSILQRVKMELHPALMHKIIYGSGGKLVNACFCCREVNWKPLFEKL